MKIHPNETVKYLTKREYFAALAMQAMLSNGRYAGLKFEAVAKDSVDQADALLAGLGEVVL